MKNIKEEEEQNYPKEKKSALKTLLSGNLKISGYL